MTGVMNAMPFGLARRIFTKDIRASVARVERANKAEPKTEKWESRYFNTTIAANAIMGGIFGFFVSATAGAAGYTIFGIIPIGPVVQAVTTAGCFAGGALSCIVPGRPRERGVFAFINRAMQNIGLIAFSGLSTIAIFLALAGGDQRSTDEIKAANEERKVIVTARRAALSDARGIHALVVEDIDAIRKDIDRQKLTIAALEREYAAWDHAVRNEFAPGTGSDNSREKPSYAPRVGKKAEIALAKEELDALRANMKDREGDASSTLGAVTSAGDALNSVDQKVPFSVASQGFFSPAWALIGKALNVSSQSVALFASFIASFVIVFAPIFKAIERGREATRVHREAEKTTRATMRRANKAAKKAARRSWGSSIRGLFAHAPEPVEEKPQEPAVLYWSSTSAPPPVVRSASDMGANEATSPRATPKPTAPGCPETLAVIEGVRNGTIPNVGVTTLAKLAGVGSEKAKRIQAALVERGMAEYTANGCKLTGGAA